MTSAYEQQLRRLLGLNMFGIRLGLANITRLIEALANPQKRFQSVHIAGTNGKGSCAAFVERILREAGHRTGLTTSPHLNRYTERFLVGGREAEQELVARTLQRVLDTAVGEELPVTFFEASIGTAFLLFAEAGVEIAVVETGLGGRLDATNVLLPLVSVITRVALDHTAYLGDTIVAVAGEKTRIIKPGRPAVVWGTDEEVRQVHLEQARQVQAPVRWFPGEFELTEQGDGTRTYASKRGWRLPGLQPGLAGAHQDENLSLALAAIEELRDLGIQVHEPAVREGVRKVSWPGRLQWLDADFPILVDGAHNPDAIAALARTLPLLEPERRPRFVVGMMGDKDILAVFEQLAAPGTRLHLAAAKNDRAAEPELLARIAAEVCPEAAVTIHDSLGEAVDSARAELRSSEFVVATGSLFAVGEVLAHVEGREGDPL